MITGVIIGAVIAGVGVFIFVKPKASQCPEKCFGLNEMEAAERFVKTDGERNAVKGVLLGVLGYKNTIEEDLDQLADEAAESDSAMANRAADNHAAIADREDKIAKLKAEIKNLHQGIESLEASRAEKQTAFEEKERKAAKWA
ncbi:MAG: hypothetical protein Q7S81_01820 [bacterium]|nr:hypothetical protein [bacterium]